MRVRITCVFEVEVPKNIEVDMYANAVMQRYIAAAAVVEQHVRINGVRADNILKVEVVHAKA